MEGGMEEASERWVPWTTEGAELGWLEWPRERGPTGEGAGAGQGRAVGSEVLKGGGGQDRAGQGSGQ